MRKLDPAIETAQPRSGGTTPQRDEAGDTIAASPGAKSQERWERLRDAVIMMVDDEPITIEVTQIYLEEAGYSRFVSTDEPQRTLDLIRSERPDLLLLDVVMPDTDGFDILHAMDEADLLEEVPTIVLTSSTDAETKLRALELGATDFLSKPVDPSELALRVRNALAAKAYRDRLAHYDLLTGLPNRQTFVNRLDWALRHALRHKQTGAALHIDIDGFKQINDALGPEHADQLLREIAERIGNCVRGTDTLGRAESDERQPSLSRLAGDEFVVLLPVIAHTSNAAHVAKRVLDAIAEPISLAGQVLQITCCIGISTYPENGEDVNSIVANASAAMHQAKRLQKHSYQYYSSEFNANALHKLTLATELRKAIEHDELSLFYQPKLSVGNGRLCGAEALVRWQHPERGMVSPGEFIPVAEETGLIVPLGEWVLNAACQQATAWQAADLRIPRISVNVSSEQFRQGSLLQTVAKILVDTGANASQLVVEITEGVIMENADANIQILQAMKAMGVRLSMDDFGTGYSSLSYLNRFPIDELKIDRSFVAEVAQPGDYSAIVSAIIAMAHSMRLIVVAEGVEHQHQLQFLRSQGCDEYQGFMISRPVPPEEFSARFLATDNPAQEIGS
ncbi:MAG: EAL domain-containing protein [Betaproteobacteria bacterium]|nr:MAG: EAL domain-containing protein [Betaproteobacteria bacterium]